MTPRQFAGRLLYGGYHAPLGRIRGFFADGGPLERRRTEQGRKAMENAAYVLPPAAVKAGAPLAVHLLSGRRFWYQTAFCLQSLSLQTACPIAPVIYDDGTLEARHCDALTRLFPAVKFVSKSSTLEKLDRLLPRSHFPVLRERWEHYPNLRKLIDPHLGSNGWKLVIDSDLLFFHRPDLLIAWVTAPKRPLHAVDVRRSYGYSDALLQSLAHAPLADRLNVGLCGLRSEELDWEKIEWLCTTLIANERTNYYLEQALVAVLLAGRECTVAPERDYLTFPCPPEATECHAIMHHYVAGSKRWYFQQNWRRFAGAASR